MWYIFTPSDFSASFPVVSVLSSLFVLSPFAGSFDSSTGSAAFSVVPVVSLVSVSVAPVVSVVSVSVASLVSVSV